MIVRGGPEDIPITFKEMEQLAADGWRWSGHTHPGSGNVLAASKADLKSLAYFRAAGIQKNSVIMNSEGLHYIYPEPKAWVPRPNIRY